MAEVSTKVVYGSSTLNTDVPGVLHTSLLGVSSTFRAASTESIAAHAAEVMRILEV